MSADVRGNTPEIVQRVDPEVTVVHVDHDPVVPAHGRALREGNELTHSRTPPRAPPYVCSASGARVRAVWHRSDQESWAGVSSLVHSPEVWPRRAGALSAVSMDRVARTTAIRPNRWSR